MSCIRTENTHGQGQEAKITNKDIDLIGWWNW